MKQTVRHISGYGYSYTSLYYEQPCRRTNPLVPLAYGTDTLPIEGRMVMKTSFLLNRAKYGKKQYSQYIFSRLRAELYQLIELFVQACLQGFLRKTFPNFSFIDAQFNLPLYINLGIIILR